MECYGLQSEQERLDYFGMQPLQYTGQTIRTDGNVLHSASTESMAAMGCGQLGTLNSRSISPYYSAGQLAVESGGQCETIGMLSFLHQSHPYRFEGSMD